MLRDFAAALALCFAAVWGDGDAEEAVFVPPIQREWVVDGSQQSGYVLEFRAGSDSTSFQCIATKGGLITDFKLNGENLLFDHPSPDKLDGSIFWPSPQSLWDWPPPRAIDPTLSQDFTSAYEVQVDEEAMAITLTSPVNDTLGLKVAKTFSLDLESQSIHLMYSIVNVGEGELQVAPWEISRVLPGGLTFYPAGTLEPSSGKFKPLSVTKTAKVIWFQHVGQLHAGKLFADAGAGGWIAHTNGKLLLVKAFPRTSPEDAAPGEAQIEIFADTEYVEVEAQGRYSTVPAGGQLDWSTHWFLRKLPDGIPRAPSEELAAFAAGLGSPSCGPTEKDVDYVVVDKWYRVVDHVPDGGSCCAECQDILECQSWTWVKDAQLPSGNPGQCWLKGGVPSAKKHKVGVISGFRSAERATMTTGAPPGSTDRSAERATTTTGVPPGGTDRIADGKVNNVTKPPAEPAAAPPDATEADVDFVVQDAWFRQIDHVAASDACSTRCREESKCKVWTWVKDAKLPDGNPGQCWLKGADPSDKKRKLGVVSGYRGANSAEAVTSTVTPTAGVGLFRLLTTRKLIGMQGSRVRAVVAALLIGSVAVAMVLIAGLERRVRASTPRGSGLRLRHQACGAPRGASSPADTQGLLG